MLWSEIWQNSFSAKRFLSPFFERTTPPFPVASIVVAIVVHQHTAAYLLSVPVRPKALRVIRLSSKLPKNKILSRKAGLIISETLQSSGLGTPYLVFSV
jgi:hypothetical protein